MPRKPLIKRLPKIWERLDHDQVLERYLGLWDIELDGVHDKITDLLSSRNLDKIPDRFLWLLGDLVGHKWRGDKTRDWNRRRIRDAIRRWSYKGTLACVGDLVVEFGGTEWSVADMASTVMVWGRQGTYGAGNIYYSDYNRHHDGVFLLYFTDEVDFDAFRLEFEDIKPAGEKWVFVIVHELPLLETGTTAQLGSGGGLSFWVPPDAAYCTFQFITEQHFNGFVGGILSCDLPIQIDHIADIAVNTGTPVNPLPPEISIIQSLPEHG